MSQSENPQSLWRHSSRQQVHPACSYEEIRCGGSKRTTPTVNRQTAHATLQGLEGEAPRLAAVGARSLVCKGLYWAQALSSPVLQLDVLVCVLLNKVNTKPREKEVHLQAFPC